MSFFENSIKIFTTSQYLSMVLKGLWTTFYISFGAMLLGFLIGTLVAIVRIIPSESKLMIIPKFICSIYTTIIRGTPMALQLFIMAFVIFAIRGFPMAIIAIIAFGINSGAYVSENIRAGIQSVDHGQMEAGLALGITWGKTMKKIIIPQAIKNVIPSIGNEIIALIKETSIVSMVGGLYDLTLVAKIIGSGQYMATYLAPMVVVALFYLAIVYLIVFLVKFIEKQLGKSERKSH